MWKKRIFILLVVLGASSLFAQQTTNTNKKGFAADGYDVVAYFEDKATEGEKAFVTEIEGVKYKFSSAENLKKFKANPKKYQPQYGGWCGYAIGAKNEKVDINPKTFEIRDGKLYLFYNSWGINTLKLWNEEGAEVLKKKADENWRKL
ncbi:YHS domain-containing (seleno)protein [Flavicella sediminum]|uniref:YHS domain-containing (seleno)protein n=1 Tax=Flavicella sediminum TaxID=2585141 RepID=UPI00111EA702|nr:YHS domain-containing (seleno)protein [Flavicella sediminum]